MEPVVIEFTTIDGDRIAHMGRTIDHVLEELHTGVPIRKDLVESQRQVPLDEAKSIYSEWYDRAYKCVTNIDKQPTYYLGSPKKN